MHKNNALVDAPIFKGVSIPKDANIVPYRDSQVIATDGPEYSSNTLQFFPSTASQSNVDSNYEKNPLPKNRSYDILGVGVGFSLDAMRVRPGDQSALPVGLDRFVNGITHGRVLFETSTKTELIDDHLKTCSAAQGTDFCIEPASATGTNDGFTRQLSFPGELTPRRSEPIHLETQETFQFDVEWESGDWVPSISEWNALGQGALKAIATMTVAYY